MSGWGRNDRPSHPDEGSQLLDPEVFGIDLQDPRDQHLECWDQFLLTIWTFFGLVSEKVITICIKRCHDTDSIQNVHLEQQCDGTCHYSIILIGTLITLLHLILKQNKT